MKYIHQREHLNEDDIVVIECSQTCNIRLMNDANFRSFKNGGRHTYHGGAFDSFPAKITVPCSGARSARVPSGPSGSSSSGAASTSSLPSASTASGSTLSTHTPAR